MVGPREGIRVILPQLPSFIWLLSLMHRYIFLPDTYNQLTEISSATYIQCVQHSLFVYIMNDVANQLTVVFLFLWSFVVLIVI